MRRIIITLAALLATAGLVYAGFLYAADTSEAPSARLPLVRVWAAEQEPDVWSWLRKRAKQYEKETGVRVYLRAASREMAQEAGGAFPPDLLISGSGDTVVALRGYALFFRDSTARAVTPHPTSLLFVPSSPTPGPSPTPAPTPDIARFSVILIPDTLVMELPGGVRSARVFLDFEEGKGDAALLTAEQAKQLPFPVSACPLPKGKGGLPICGSAATAGGEAFLAFLCAEPSQQALADTGLFSPRCFLYQGTDPLREMIENAL